MEIEKKKKKILSISKKTTGPENTFPIFLLKSSF